MNKLIVLLVAACVATTLSAKAADAAENFKTHCVKCHGEDGKGQTKMGQKAGCKDLTDAKVQADIKDDKASKSIKEGMRDGDKTLMKPFGEVLSDDEIKALVAYVHAFKK